MAFNVDKVTFRKWLRGPGADIMETFIKSLPETTQDRIQDLIMTDPSDGEKREKLAIILRALSELKMGPGSSEYDALKVIYDTIPLPEGP